METEKTLYILDAYAFIYRSFYAFNSKPLINEAGFNVGSIFGFFKTLHSLIKKYRPPYFAVALDSKVPTFRHKMYSQYKANRRESPKELHEQVPIIENILRSCGFAVEEMDGYEADDIIASLVRRARKEGFGLRIISGDKDLLQLVDPNVTMLKQEKGGKWEEYGIEEVKRDWDVPPSLILDLLSLTGDSADNVPGVKGIGGKTAAKLLNEYKSLEEIYEKIDNIKGSTKTKLLSGKEDAFFSKKLIKLNDSLAVGNMDRYQTKSINFANSIPIFKKYGLPSLIKLYSEPLIPNQSDVENIEATTNIEVGVFNGSVIVLNTFSEIKKVLDIAQKEPSINLILEEKIENKQLDVSFSFQNSQYTFSLIFCDEYIKVEHEAVPRKEVIDAIDHFFLSNAIFVLHDAKTLWHILQRQALNFPKNIFDPMIALYLIQPEKKDYSFEELKSFLQDLSQDNNIKLESQLEILQISYNILPKHLENLGLSELFWKIEIPLIPLLANMEKTGIKLNREYLKSFEKELTENIEMLEKNATQLVGECVNLASYKQLQTLLFEKRGVIPAKKIKTGFSTSSEVLEKLVGDDPLIPIILEYRTLSKLKSTYTTSLIELADENSRVHTHFIQTGTATGRLSSQNPNLQNIPARSDLGLKVRGAFCAEEGKKLVSSDYSQIELVVLSHISGDEVLQKIIREGVDVHKRVASLIFNVAEDLVTNEMRTMAKAINFGVIYGMSAYGLSEELHISRNDAKTFIESYFETYKGVKAFIEETYAKCKESGEVRTLFGRRRSVPEIQSSKRQIKELGQRIAVNTIIQGSAADIMKKAMIDVDVALKKAKIDAKILLQVHDELILEAWEEDLDAVITRVKSAMEGAFNLSIPLRCSISTGKRWGSL